MQKPGFFEKPGFSFDTSFSHHPAPFTRITRERIRAIRLPPVQPHRAALDLPTQISHNRFAHGPQGPRKSREFFNRFGAEQEARPQNQVIRIATRNSPRHSATANTNPKV